MHEKTIEIRWRDMDAFCHVTNAVSLTYLEEVGDEWLERILGRPESLWGFVIVHASIDFRHELRLEDDGVIARCWLKAIGNSSARLSQDIVKLGGTLSAEAEVVLVARDRNQSGSHRLTGQERSALERELERARSGRVPIEDSRDSLSPADAASSRL
jgi:acyl-CoA thioester hydrolase